MAGIGFELKKLFRGKGYLSNIKGLIISSLVTVGPMILCITLTTVIQSLFVYVKIPFSDRELFLTSTVYAFIFSLIFASIFIMLASRYISDMVFVEAYDNIMSSLYGVLAICIPVAGLVGIIFYWFSPINFVFKLASYIFYMELVIIWIQSIYISLFKDFAKIFKGFAFGVLAAITLAFIIVFFTGIKKTLGVMIAVDIGFFVIIVSYMNYFMKFATDTDGNIFDFLRYIDKYPALIFISLFYNVGMYAHNFVFWSSKYGAHVAGTYSSCTFYDLPMFYAYFTIIPTLVLFVVKVETNFMVKYKNYYGYIVSGGNNKEIQNAKQDMITVLIQEITHIMEVQLFFSIIAIVLGRKFLPLMGLTALSIDIFTILVLGCYVFAMMFIVMLIQLYFDDRKGALLTVGFFLPANIILSIITLNMGENFFGFGFFISGFLSLIIALGRLIYYVRNIDYYTFCSQPILYREKRGFFTKLSDKLSKLNSNAEA